MPHRQILATVLLAHHFESAFTPDQVYRYLRVPMSRTQFVAHLGDLKASGRVWERDGALFAESLAETHRRKRGWSRALFAAHRPVLGLLTRFPWVRFMALTGANSFESCRQRDDIDLFIVTRRGRLWLCYGLLALFSKLVGRRGLLCINYLVDEDHLAIEPRDYYTAVQIVQMVPLLDGETGDRLLAANPWLFEVLPNAAAQMGGLTGYRLRTAPSRESRAGGLLSRLNRSVYRRYARHLAAKFPADMGSGIVLGEGLAKLNRVDHHDIYESIYRRIDARIAV